MKANIYSHQCFSLGVISFTLLSLVIDFTFYNEEEKIIYALIYYFFGSLLYCLYDILRKKYFNLYYHSPYIIMLFIGFFGSIILIIYDMIMNYYYLENKHFIIIKSFHENVTLFFKCVFKINYFEF